MDISLIISTWNNAGRLGDTLTTLTQLAVDPSVRWELVLVNNACTDRTDAVAAQFARHLPMRYLHEPHLGKSRALNLALGCAAGELIVFTDDDVYVRPDWLMRYWRAYRAKRQGWYFGSSIRSRYEGEPPSAPLRRIAPPSVVGLELGATARALRSGEDFVGANWAAPATGLRQLGGFDEALGLNAHARRLSVGEESDLMHRFRRAGWRPWHVPEARIEHRVPAKKCMREHIVGRRIAQFRGEALGRYGGTSVRAHGGARRALARALYFWGRAGVAPLLGRTGLLSRAQARGYFEAAGLLARQHVEEDGEPAGELTSIPAKSEAQR